MVSDFYKKYHSPYRNTLSPGKMAISVIAASIITPVMCWGITAIQHIRIQNQYRTAASEVIFKMPNLNFGDPVSFPYHNGTKKAQISYIKSEEGPNYLNLCFSLEVPGDPDVPMVYGVCHLEDKVPSLKPGG